MLQINSLLHILYNAAYKYFICIAAPGWHLSPSWQRAASPQISAYHQHYALCSMWWWMPRTSQPNYVLWRWAKRYKLHLGQCHHVKETSHEYFSRKCCRCFVFLFVSSQKQFHSQIDELIEESVRDMIQLLVAKVPPVIVLDKLIKIRGN